MGHVTDKASYPWQYIYVVIASLRMLLGIYMWFFLPTLPSEASFLPDEEKVIATKRVAGNMAGIKTIQ